MDQPNFEFVLKIFLTLISNTLLFALVQPESQSRNRFTTVLVFFSQHCSNERLYCCLYLRLREDDTHGHPLGFPEHRVRRRPRDSGRPDPDQVRRPIRWTNNIIRYVHSGRVNFLTQKLKLRVKLQQFNKCWSKTGAGNYFRLRATFKSNMRMLIQSH